MESTETVDDVVIFLGKKSDVVGWPPGDMEIAKCDKFLQNFAKSSRNVYGVMLNVIFLETKVIVHEFFH